MAHHADVLFRDHIAVGCTKTRATLLMQLLHLVFRLGSSCFFHHGFGNFSSTCDCFVVFQLFLNLSVLFIYIVPTHVKDVNNQIVT